MKNTDSKYTDIYFGNKKFRDDNVKLENEEQKFSFLKRILLVTHDINTDFNWKQCTEKHTRIFFLCFS